MILFLGAILSLFFYCSPKSASILDAPVITQKVAAKAPANLASDAHSNVNQIPVDERVVKGKLSNGLSYYVQKNNKPENRAELRLVVKTGSIMEDPDQLGLAHFVEHMAFNGTKNFAKNELVNYLESVGTRFGPDLNAYTSFDETVYMLQVRTDSTELFDKGMLILRDWASDISFDHEEIDKERGVVISEWRSRLSPDQRMQQVYFPVMYHGSRYADRLPIGEPDIIQNATYETIKRFYKDWYRPDLMSVVVVGDIDIPTVERKISELFGALAPATPQARPRVEYSVPSHPETLVSIVGDKEASFTQIQLIYKHPKLTKTKLNDYRDGLVHNLYNEMLGARLSELTKSADPPFVFAFSGYNADVGDIDSYSSFAMVPEGKSLTALETLLTENKRVMLHGFTSGELIRAKKIIMERIETNYKEADKTESARLAMRYVYNFLEQTPIPSPKQTLELYETYMPTIGIEEINMLAKQWIRDENNVVVITGPLKESIPLPTEGQVRNTLSAINQAVIDPYEDELIETPFFNHQLTAQAIVKEESFASTGIDYLELSNGVGVYLKKTDFKNDEVLFTGMSPGGSSLYNDEDYDNVSNAASIISESGLGDFDQVQLSKLFAGKKVSLRPYIGGLSEGFNGSASPDDIELLFQMLYKYFHEPRVDNKAFESYKAKQKGIYKNLMSNPNFFFSDFVSKTVYQNHMRVGFPDPNGLDRIDFDRAVEIFRERFSDAADFKFTIVGAFDREVLLPLIQKYLGNLPSKKTNETWKDIGIRPVKGGLVKRIQRGEAPKTNVNLQFLGDYEFNDDNNYQMQSMIDYLRIKLREALREDLGGVYGVGIYGGGSKKPYENYTITISFNADPPMTDKLIDAAKEVIKKAIDEGPSEEDLTKVRETQRQTRIKDLQENRFWQQNINQRQEENKQFDNILLESLEKRINALSTQEIQAAVTKYFDFNHYIQLVMDPEPKAEN